MKPRDRRGLVIGLAGAVVVVIAIAGGAIWLGLQLADQLGAPGVASATGSGRCGSADAVSIDMAFSDGHTVQACTRNRPACAGEVLDNQLRSTGRRYILLIRWSTSDGGSPGDVLSVEPAAFLPKPGPTETRAPSGTAVIQVVPRDPTEDAYTPQTGTIALSPAQGTVHGTIDATLDPSSPLKPVRIAGEFTCDG